MPLLFEDEQVTGNTPPNIYDSMEPWVHSPSGALWWISDVNGQPFVDSDGQTYHIRKRTHTEIEAILFAGRQASDVTDWNRQINQFIYGYFDAGTQISFVKLYIQTSNPAIKAAMESVDIWVTAVMAYYYEVKSQLEQATTLTELDAIQAAIDVERDFGAAGVLLAAPPVTLRQFFV